MQRIIGFLTAAVLATGLNARSVKLPDWNAIDGTAGAVSHFFQPTEGLDLLDGDGTMFIMVEMPKGETKFQSGDYGFARYLMGTDRRATASNNFFLSFNPPGNYFLFKATSAAGIVKVVSDTLRFDVGLIDETAVLVMVERSNDIFTIRAVSGTDGTVYGTATADTLAGFTIGAKTGDNGFAVGGTATNPTDATFDRERGHNGNIEFVGYVTKTVSDADARAIALGADPAATLAEADFRWYRHFAGAEAESTLAPTLPNDASRPTVVRGAEYMVGGATIRRQAEQSFLLLDYIPDGRVWGVYSHDQASKEITLTGSHRGITGGTGVQVRVLNAADMAVVTDWTDATTTVGDSTWQATFTMLKSHNWDYLEVRSAADTNLVCRSRSRCGVGYKIGMMGQSETHYAIIGYGGGMAYDGEAVSFVTHALEKPSVTIGSRLGVNTPQIFVAGPHEKLSDGVLALARQLRQYTDAPVCVVNHAYSGTAVQALCEDDNTSRKWSNLEEMVRLAGNDYSLMHWMWWVSANFGLSYGRLIFDPTVLGINPGDYDHYLYDGTFAPGMKFGVAGFWGLAFSRVALPGTTTVYNHADLNPTIEGQYRWRDANTDGHAGIPGFGGTNGSEFPVGWDIECDGTHWGHSDKNSPMGPTRLGYRAGEFVARVLGLSHSENPKQQNAWFGNTKDVINVRFSRPNGGILHTAGASSVAGLWTSTDGTNWVKNGHTAVISDADSGIVTMTKNNGTWPDSIMVAFGMHQVLLDDSASCLYEGPKTGTGTGALAMEDGLGIPVQPCVPVAHATAKVVVQGSDPGAPTSGIGSSMTGMQPYTGAPVMYTMDGHPVNAATAGPGIYVTRTADGLKKMVLVK